VLGGAGIPVLAATDGLEIGLGATALAAGGIMLTRLRRARAAVPAVLPADDVAIACSLSPADLGDRGVEWRALLDTSLVSAERIPSGVRVTVKPDAAGELNRLVDLERGCCAWMKFDFAGPATVSVTAPGDGEDVLVTMFLERDSG
jgi:hypothetical protein